MTGEPRGDEVNGLEFLSAEGSDVTIARHLGPVFGQDLSAVGVDLDLPLAGEACPLQAQIDGADAGEGGSEGELGSHSFFKKSPGLKRGMEPGAFRERGPIANANQKMECSPLADNSRPSES